MEILVTGAAGFLGQRLVQALLDTYPQATIVAADIVPCPMGDPRVDVQVGSITDGTFVEAIVRPDVAAVYHLAAVLSGQSEAEFDIGMAVNVDATRSLLEACRHLPHAPRVVFASSVAVYGGPLPETVPEDFAPMPESSYGTGKAIAELLVNDYTRRVFLDGVVCRLPTVAVRPGRPNSALSSFVSGIIREPLNGESSVCPVPLDTRLWVTSPEVVTHNLLHAGRLDTQALDGRRNINLPGITVTPGELLDSLERLGGADARRRVDCAVDPYITSIVRTWPGGFDVSRPLQLGFEADTDVDGIVGQYQASL